MKYSIIGLVIWILAAIYWFFQKISNVVPMNYDSTETHTLDIFTIEGIFGLDWINSIPWPKVYPAVEFIATTHISLLMLAIGLIFIIIGMFFKT